MMRFQRLSRLASFVLLLGLGGCAYLPHFAHWVRISPVKPAAIDPNARENGYYASAVNAINRRDYGEALDLLQAADELKQNDVRVINAFGVVYDKLGRFDLSDRYYEQARALDPKSSIVAHNMAYSAMMQAKGEAAPNRQAVIQLAKVEVVPAQIFPAQISPEEAAPAAPEPARRAVIRLGFAPSASPPPALTLAGRALDITDASGRKDGAQPVRQQLVRLGWTSPTLETRAAHRLAKTTVSYPARSLGVAQALARTLPAGVQLVDCGRSCDNISLIVGADSLGWSLRGSGLQRQRGQ